jgi:hypothetical protein
VANWGQHAKKVSNFVYILIQATLGAVDTYRNCPPSVYLAVDIKRVHATFMSNGTVHDEFLGRKNMFEKGIK